MELDIGGEVSYFWKKKKNMEGLIPDFNNILDKLLGLYIKM